MSIEMSAAVFAAASAAAESGNPLLAIIEEPKNWILVGLAAFMAIAWRMGAFKAITHQLDSRSARIAASLAEAEKLRAEAQALVTEYQQKKLAAEGEARVIVAQARADAEALRNAARAELDADLARRERITDERIARAEQQVIAEARAVAARAAIEAAERLLAREVTPAVQARLVREGVEDLRRRFS